VIIERRYAADDRLESLFVFSLWGKLRFLGAVVRIDLIFQQASRLVR
jgi:hypothetical protein